MQIVGTSQPFPTPQGGDAGDPAPPSPPARKKSLKRNLCCVPAFSSVRTLASCWGGAARLRGPEHRELKPEQLPAVSATIERGPRAPPAGGGRLQDGSGPECRREGEAGAPERPGERAGSGPAGGAQSRAAQVGQAGWARASILGGAAELGRPGKRRAGPPNPPAYPVSGPVGEVSVQCVSGWVWK